MAEDIADIEVDESIFGEGRVERAEVNEAFNKLLETGLAGEIRFKIPGESEPFDRAVILPVLSPVPDRNDKHVPTTYEIVDLLNEGKIEEARRRMRDASRYLAITTEGDAIEVRHDTNMSDIDPYGNPLNHNRTISMIEKGDVFDTLEQALNGLSTLTKHSSRAYVTRGADQAKRDADELMNYAASAIDLVRRFPPAPPAQETSLVRTPYTATIRTQVISALRNQPSPTTEYPANSLAE